MGFPGDPDFGGRQRRGPGVRRRLLGRGVDRRSDTQPLGKHSERILHGPTGRVRQTRGLRDGQQGLDRIDGGERVRPLLVSGNGRRSPRANRKSRAGNDIRECISISNAVTGTDGSSTVYDWCLSTRYTPYRTQTSSVLVERHTGRPTRSRVIGCVLYDGWAGVGFSKFIGVNNVPTSVRIPITTVFRRRDRRSTLARVLLGRLEQMTVERVRRRLQLMVHNYRSQNRNVNSLFDRVILIIIQTENPNVGNGRK